MEDFTTGFDIDGLLSEEEAAQLFSEDSGDDTALMQEMGEEDNGSPEQEAEEPEETREPEKVGNRKVNDKEKEDVQSDDGGSSSPNVFYSSIAGALKDEGVFPDLDDDTIKGIQGPEDFLELFEKAVTSRMDERIRRVDEALGAGNTRTPCSTCIPSTRTRSQPKARRATISGGRYCTTISSAGDSLRIGRRGKSRSPSTRRLKWMTPGMLSTV